MRGDSRPATHRYPEPPVVLIVKEEYKCPRCGAGVDEGFDLLIDNELELGAACKCFVCGYSF